MSIIFTKKCPYCSQTIQGDARTCMYCSRELGAVTPRETVPIKASSAKKHISPVAPLIIVVVLGIWIIFTQMHKNGSINSSPYATSTQNIPKDMRPGIDDVNSPEPTMLGRPMLPPDGKRLRTALGFSFNFMEHPILLKASNVHVISESQKGRSALVGVITNPTKFELYNVMVLYQTIGTHPNLIGNGQQAYPFLPPGDKIDLKIPIPHGVQTIQIIHIYGSRSKHPRTNQFP